MKLKQTLSNMVDAHQQLLQLAKEKRAFLIEGNVSKLEVVIGKESKYTEIIRKLDEQREQQVQQFMLEKSCVDGTYTMGKLIEMVDNLQEKYYFSSITENLKGIVHEISQLNKNNQQLIQMTLSYIQYSINILMPKEPMIGYGKKTKASSVKFLDAKI
jgi:flagellar biosynthesis/type III secretory pathway chaperone